MWDAADRMVKTFADLTVGTIIVLVHVALADRLAERTSRRLLQPGLDQPRPPSRHIA